MAGVDAEAGCGYCSSMQKSCPKSCDGVSKTVKLTFCISMPISHVGREEGGVRTRVWGNGAKGRNNNNNRSARPDLSGIHLSRPLCPFLEFAIICAHVVCICFQPLRAISFSHSAKSGQQSTERIHFSYETKLKCNERIWYLETTICPLCSCCAFFSLSRKYLTSVTRSKYSSPFP